MNAIAVLWTHWATRFAALTRRERSIVAAAVLFGGGFLIFSFGIEPFLLKARSEAKAESAARKELVGQQTQLVLLATQKSDPDAVNLRRLAHAKQELAAVSGRIVSFEAGMVPSTRMQAVLEGLLARNRAIELLGLKTLPVTLVGAHAKAEAPAGAGAQSAKDLGKDRPEQREADQSPGERIYQHGIEVELAGSYNDLLNYLTELERMPQRLMWNSVTLTAVKYPRNVMVLRVYTLSFDKNWLIV